MAALPSASGDPVHPGAGCSIFTFDLGPGETASVPDLPGSDGPVMVLMGGEGG